MLTSATGTAFHDLAVAVAKLSGRTLVLDGEVAIFDQQLRGMDMRFWLEHAETEMRELASESLCSSQSLASTAHADPSDGRPLVH